MKRLLFLVSAIFLLSCPTLQAIEFDEYGAVDIHGYVSQGYLQSDKNNYFCRTEDGDTDFYEIGVSMTSEVSDHLRIGVQFLSYTLGDFGNRNFHVNWAHATYQLTDWFGIIAGRSKIYHGLFNRNRDADFLRTSILLPQSIYNEAWRSTISAANGFEIFGNVHMGVMGRLEYNTQVGKPQVEPDSGVSIAAKEKLLDKSLEETGLALEFNPYDVKEDLSYVGRLMWETPLSGLSLNFTYWNFPFDMIGTGTLSNITIPGAFIFNTEAQSATASISYTYGHFRFISEYSFSTYDFELTSSSVNYTSDLDTEGYYATVIYRFTDWLESGLYYSVYYPDMDDEDGSSFTPKHAGWQKDTCLSFRFDLSNNWVFKLEGHVFNGTAVMMKVHNAVDYDTSNIDLEENWILFGAKLTFSF